MKEEMEIKKTLEFNSDDAMLEATLFGHQLVIEIHQADYEGMKKATYRFLTNEEAKELGEWLIQMSDR